MESITIPRHGARELRGCASSQGDVLLEIPQVENVWRNPEMTNWLPFLIAGIGNCYSVLLKDCLCFTRTGFAYVSILGELGNSFSSGC